MTDKLGPAVVRKTVTMQVTERLREMIFSGELISGEKLKQEKLAAQLGVSRVPIREGLNQLVAEGLVKVEVHKGAVVSGLSIEALEEMYELRGQIEPWLLGLAIPQMTAKNLEAAEDILDTLLNKSHQIHWSGLNWQFHRSLYLPANKPQSLGILERLYMNTYRHFPVPSRFTIGLEAMDAEHRHLLQLIRDGEIHEAQEYLRDHIMRGSGSLIERMKGAQPEIMNSEA